MRLTPSEFAAKWIGSTRTERASSQEHFIDLCRMLDQQTPNEADQHGDWYAFEKGAEKTAGGDGFADVWKRGHFGWEYKGKHKDLKAAYNQLLQYREALENPPFLVVCDLDRFEIHTNFTGTKKTVYAFNLDDFRISPEQPLRILRAVMSDPVALKPGQTPEQVTEEAAGKFAELAGRLQSRGQDALGVAHFLNRLLFCLFAEDIGLLPKGLFTRLTEMPGRDPADFDRQLRELFSMMAEKGGYFGTEYIDWFNGGMFQDSDTIPLDRDDVVILADASRLDWSSVEPSILGTLFERGLDPTKRGQLGAHYTDRASILRVVVPVVIEPLRLEFEEMKSRVLELKESGKKKTARTPRHKDPVKVFRDFLDRLRAVTVLDPACGSGNFLYVALQELKNLEKEAILWSAEALGIAQEFPGVGPQVVKGIEISPYAAELAKVTIWIGEIQWMINNGFGYRRNPVLQPLENVECRDAVLDVSDPARPTVPTWPAAEFIVGNPPFIGGKKLRESLGDEYVEALFTAWDGRVPREADFVCYWHEAARRQIEAKGSRRAGLLATQGIRGGANQLVLKKIKETGDIFEAWRDEAWVVDGAAVRISIVCQDDGSWLTRRLDGEPVAVIHADLTGGAKGAADLTTAVQLKENLGLSFMGDTKGGAFDISGEVAREMLAVSGNPNGRPNSDVVVPWMNAMDLTRRSRGMFIIDFGVDMDERAAAMYQAPFEYITKHVRPLRSQNKRAAYATRWWLHVEARPAMRRALAPLRRFIVTPTTAKHRTFAWLEPPMLPDHQLIVVARDDDYTLGILHSRPHEIWALRKIGRKGVGNDPVYAPTFAFENFPFPWPLRTPVVSLTAEQKGHHTAISQAAKALDEARSRWLNPSELVRLEPDVAPILPARRIPVDLAAEKALKKRTLTNLYNDRPAWLDMLHRDLDQAVSGAYGWPSQLTEEELLGRLLRLNLERAGIRA